MIIYIEIFGTKIALKNSMTEIIQEIDIEKQIYIIRGIKVMLDKDLAKLYGVKTKALNQSVRRNIKRFPEDFMFLLSRQEILNLSQIVTSSNIKHSPNILAFTEQGVAMLSSVLRSEKAIQVNIAIMRVFIRLKQITSTHKEFNTKLNELERKIKNHDADITNIFEALRKLMSPEIKTSKKIGFISN